jgi:hypothetical protein
MWWYRLVSLGRRRNTVEEGIAVEWFRTCKNVVVILDSFPVTPEAEDLWRGYDAPVPVEGRGWTYPYGPHITGD